MAEEKSVLDQIASLTNGTSFKTYKYSYDGIEMPGFDCDDHNEIIWTRSGETENIKSSRDLKPLADKLVTSHPLFSYFLDGSRRIYKVDDMAYSSRMFPILAGQVGVGCCTRVNMDMQPLYYKGIPMFKRDLVIALPKVAKGSDHSDAERVFERIRKKINENYDLVSRGASFAKIIPYPTNVDEGERIDNKGIAVIQDYMVEQEKLMVDDLTRKNLLDSQHYLVKDGSLEYPVHKLMSKELERFRNNYRFVVGVSKSFNPEKCVDKKKLKISKSIAQLPLYHRTPVNMYQDSHIGNLYFAIWFVRIRDVRYTSNAFDGILKLEKILVNDDQISNGLDSEEVDFITANIINERNPVCYGVDKRWANHLYPVHITERFIKSRYIGESMFLNLF